MGREEILNSGDTRVYLRWKLCIGIKALFRTLEFYISHKL